MWTVEVEPEVENWINSLSVKEFAKVIATVERLEERGNRLRFPASRPLGDGLFELRFELGRTAQRVTFYFADAQRIVLLTVFQKQRQQENVEIRRAHRAMRRCVAEGHSVEEDY